MEVVILEALKWRTDELTPLHFVDHFLALRCVGATEHLASQPPRVLPSFVADLHFSAIPPARRPQRPYGSNS